MRTTAEHVYSIAEQCFPGRVYRTRAACDAAIVAERQREAQRHPGDVLRGLAPLEGTASDIAAATPIRWRVTDAISRLQRSCCPDATDLSDEEAAQGRYLLARLMDRAKAQWEASWWLAQQEASLEETCVVLMPPVAAR